MSFRVTCRPLSIAVFFYRCCSFLVIALNNSLFSGFSGSYNVYSNLPQAKEKFRQWYKNKTHGCGINITSHSVVLAQWWHWPSASWNSCTKTIAADIAGLYHGHGFSRCTRYCCEYGTTDFNIQYTIK